MRRPFGGKTLHLCNPSCFYTTEVRSNQTLRMTYVIVLVLTDIRVDILYGHILDHGRVCVLIVSEYKSPMVLLSMVLKVCLSQHVEQPWLHTAKVDTDPFMVYRLKICVGPQLGILHVHLTTRPRVLVSDDSYLFAVRDPSHRLV